MLPHIVKLNSIALDLLFPKRCVGCGREGEFICDFCRHSIDRIFPPICPRCGRPQPGGVLCPSCISWQTAIDGIRSPFCFNGIIREAIHQLKYRNLRALSGQLAGYLRDFLIDYPLTVDLIVPVPLHPKRLKERGYNQSALLARDLGKFTGLPVAGNSLIRRQHTLPQAKTVSVTERRKNVAGIFHCEDIIIKNKQVLLIDDVSTSGATMDACARALKDAGADSVWGLALAREI